MLFSFTLQKMAKKTGKIKANKMLTPGSAPRKAGRPKKKVKDKDKTRGHYGRYQQAAMDQAIRAVKAGEMTMREASLHFEVPKATLCDKVNKKLHRVGRPTVLSDIEETVLVERLIFMGIWGFPVTPKDLTMLVKDYLDASGRTSRKM